ncbi:MAG: gliding motility-associated C-terminal domain-containing protein [Maribacter sp.]
MKQKKNIYIFLILLFLSGLNLYSQKMKNFGDLEVHTEGKLGFFGPVINDGLFFSNSGLVGLYGENNYTISGSIQPELFDLEIANPNNITLNIPVSVSSNTNFILGNLQTTKINSKNYLNFKSTSFSNGASDFSKVDGFVKATVLDHFMFPVGDELFIRPISVKAELSEADYTACYVYKNPTNIYPLYSQREVENVNTKEYWILKGKQEVTITINWNERSRIEKITEDSNDLKIVGYEISSSEWKNLGGIGNTGDITSGFLTSASFIPDNYAAITFGTLVTKTNNEAKLPLNGYHYFISPNGDGINDSFIIEELANFDSNVLHIYDRNGLLVFEAENYTDEFNGETGNTISALNRDAGLPQGIYYYIAAVNGDEFTIQGYLYIDR